MKSYNYYKDILEKLGYHDTFQESFCGVPSNVEFEDEFGNIVCLNIQPNDDYIKELEDMEDGEEYMPDFDRMEVHSAYIICSICNVSGYMDGDKSGIILKAEEPIRYSILDSIGGEDYQSYYPHKMDLFEKCIWIQHNMFEHEENIMEAHVKNLKKVRAEFDSILKKFDFYQSYSSVFDCTDDNASNRDNSDLFVQYKHKHSDLIINFETDCINGNLKIDGEIYKDTDFEQYIIDNYFTRHGKIDVDYRYLFDSDYNEDTAAYVFEAANLLYRYKESKYVTIEELKQIDLTKLPEKDYKSLIEQIQEEIKKACGN